MKLKEQNLTQAAVILLMSTVIVKLIGALFKIPLSADYALGDLGFGYFSAAYDMYIPIYTLALSGFPVAIARMVADYTAKKRFGDANRVFYISMKALLVTGLVGFVGLCVLALPLVSLTDKSGQSLYSLWAVAPSVFFCSVASVYRGYFEGLKNMVPTAVSNVIEALGKLILGLTGAIIIMRISGNPALAAAAAMMGITLGTFFSCIYLAVIHKRKNLVFIENSQSGDSDSKSRLFKKLVMLSIPVAIASLSTSITSLIDSVTLRSQLNSLLSSSSENAKLLLKDTLYNDVALGEIPTLLYGIKGKAHTLFNLVPSLTTALGVGALPLVTECFVKENRQGLKKNTELMLKLSAVISLPAAFGYIAVGKEIMELFYGETSSVLGGKILSVYGIAALFAGISVPITALLQATENQTRALLNILCGMSVKLICNLVLTVIPVVNVYGSVIGTSVCYIVIFFMHIITLIKTLKFTPSVSDCFLKPCLAAVMCGVTAFLLSRILNFKLGIIISIGLAALVYLVILLILRVISREEISEIFKK